MNWWQWLLVIAAGWLMVGITLVGVYAFRMISKANREIDQTRTEIHNHMGNYSPGAMRPGLLPPKTERPIEVRRSRGK